MGEDGGFHNGRAPAAPEAVGKGPLVPALVGFVAGAVFWHLVGFWSLVSEMVFNGPRDRTVVLSNEAGDRGGDAQAGATGQGRAELGRRIPAAGYRHGGLSGPNGLSAANCTTLSQDRPGGQYVKVPCPVGAQSVAGGLAGGGFVDDLVEELVAGHAHFRGRGPISFNGRRGASGLTTGSISARAPRRAGGPTVRGWATSLDVAPARGGR